MLPTIAGSIFDERTGVKDQPCPLYTKSLPLSTLHSLFTIALGSTIFLCCAGINITNFDRPSAELPQFCF